LALTYFQTEPREDQEQLVYYNMAKALKPDRSCTLTPWCPLLPYGIVRYS